MMFKRIIDFFKFEKKYTPRELGFKLKEGQVWCVMDDIVDRYCEPIFVTIERVHINGAAFDGKSNYGAKMNMESSSFILDNPNVKLVEEK